LAKGVKPGINRNEVYSIGVKIPPLLEQQRIVAILDEAFESIATATANAKKKLGALDALKKSLLNQAFAGEL
jgi:type I restriction enzyme S subunit